MLCAESSASFAVLSAAKAVEAIGVEGDEAGYLKP